MNALAGYTSPALVGLLTKRQRDVLDHLLDGKPNKAIAQQLGLSTRTVEAHRAKIMAKLSVSSFAELVRVTDPARFEQDFLEAVAQSFPGIVSFWGADLICQYANDGHLEWFGKTGDDVVGMALEDLLGPAHFAADKARIEGVLAGHRQRFTRVLAKADGTSGLVLVNYGPAIAASGAVYGFVVFVTDASPLEVPIGHDPGLEQAPPAPPD